MSHFNTAPTRLTLQQRALLLSKVAAAAAESSAATAAAAAAARGDLSTALDERRSCARDMQRLHAQFAIETHEAHLRAAAACIATRAAPRLFYKAPAPPPLQSSLNRLLTPPPPHPPAARCTQFVDGSGAGCKVGGGGA